jgi:hypothetical protein
MDEFSHSDLSRTCIGKYQPWQIEDNKSKPTHRTAVDMVVIDYWFTYRKSLLLLVKRIRKIVPEFTEKRGWRSAITSSAAFVIMGHETK